MLLAKMLLLIILLCIIPTNIAEETPIVTEIGENESYEIIWNDEYHVFEHKYPETPSIYKGTLTGVKNVWFTLKTFFYTLLDFDIDYTVTKEEWNGVEYEQTDQAMFSTGITHNPNHTETTISTIDPVEEYFQNNKSRVEDWDGDDPEHPDVLNVSVEIDYPGDVLDDSNYGYTTLDNTEAEGIYNGDVDYGFALDGRGAGGGSGSIYEGVNMYGGAGGDTSGMGGAFNTIFWCLIPLIFILSVMKLSGRVLK